MPTIQQKFEQYHLDNPHIFDLLVEYTIKVRNAGFEHYSIKAVFERVRWHMHVETQDRFTEFKLSNNYHSRYARLIEEKYPQFEGFFRMRPLRTP